MKAILIILIAYSLNAQDIEPVSMSFTYKGTPININQSRFQQSEFLLGWQWCGHKQTISAMKTNVIADGHHEHRQPYQSYETSNYVIAQPGKEASAWLKPFIHDAAWLTYEPGLVIPPDERFITISDDPSNPVFGFKYVTEYGTLTFTNDYDDFNKKHYRLALYEDAFSSATTNPTLVLKDPWPNDVLYTGKVGSQAALYTGKKWYLTINLRRTSASFNGYSSTISDNTPVLSIVLPYNYDYLGDSGITGGPGTNQIKFLEVPETNLNNVSTWYSSVIPGIPPLGIYIPTVQAPVTTPMSRTLTITREMIPNWLIGGEPVDINIFASFITSGTFDYV